MFSFRNVYSFLVDFIATSVIFCLLMLNFFPSYFGLFVFTSFSSRIDYTSTFRDCSAHKVCIMVRSILFIGTFLPFFFFVWIGINVYFLTVALYSRSGSLRVGFVYFSNKITNKFCPKLIIIPEVYALNFQVLDNAKLKFVEHFQRFVVKGSCSSDNAFLTNSSLSSPTS